ncbi:MAG: peptidase T [Clostridia bacterium]|nr:peptidase T [Clostridia bacterium]
MKATERFLKYVTIHTQSDSDSSLSPSTECQKDLGLLLMEELKELGLQDIRMDASGNVTATLPATPGVNGPAIALIAHMDTTPDAPGLNVKPNIITYTGSEICLSNGITLNEKLCPNLAKYLNKEIICTDGTTLLGGDNKAGIAEIMAATESIIEQNIPHGEFHVVFTTDEEIGRGIEGLDVAALNCSFAYTVDGGEIGELQYENFNAATAQAAIRGVGAHPGLAKGIMVNASKVAMEFAALLPADECPEKTEGYEGFFHLHCMEGTMTDASLTYILRDHDREKFLYKKEQFICAANTINTKYGPDTCTVTITDSYLNMREMVEPHMHIVDKAKAAFIKHGIEPMVNPIRGGTDGAGLSWKGLPCPNISAGGFNAHSVREWIPAEALERMTGVLITLVNSFIL